MKADEVEIVTCDLIRHVVPGTLSITIGVSDTRRKVTEFNYAIEMGEQPGSFNLVKPDGETYTVSPGGSCDCSDNRYRRRVSACKHVCALRMAGLLGEPTGAHQWTTRPSPAAS